MVFKNIYASWHLFSELKFKFESAELIVFDSDDEEADDDDDLIEFSISSLTDKFDDDWEIEFELDDDDNDGIVVDSNLLSLALLLIHWDFVSNNNDDFWASSSFWMFMATVVVAVFDCWRFFLVTNGICLSFFFKQQLNTLFITVLRSSRFSFFTIRFSSLLSERGHLTISSMLFGNGLFSVSGTYKEMMPQLIEMTPYMIAGNRGIILLK